ncbi:MAG: multicopper oxidase domain-containing protein [Chloroflexota bacterium]
MKYTNFFLLFSLVFLAACGTTNRGQNTIQPAQNPLRIPELIDAKDTPEIEVVLQKGAHEFYSGVQSETMGFNGDYLGPAIRLYDGMETTITFTNNIGEPTTVHGHGLHVDGVLDGGPQSRIEADESWTITVPIKQEAGTSWFHPHLMGTSAHHVHAGLAGVYLVEDENSQALNLPKDYGVNDIPLVVQDRSFTNGKMDHYAPTDQEVLDGLREDTLVINGTIDAYHNVPQGWVRLRLLNGSNARFYRFRLADDAPFYKIATEGGFLNQPVEIESLDMSPGERNEVMIDLSDGENATFVADLLPADPEDKGRFSQNLPVASIVELRVDPSLQASGELPNKLNDIVFYDPADALTVREFDLNMEVRGGSRENMDLFAVNGQPMNMMNINERISMGQIEIWRITGERMPHPFHMHGASFQILTLNGEPVTEADKGWKDTVIVGDEVTEIIIRFDRLATDATPYMFHCHIMEHEDYGMMGQFTVMSE